jgi:hypothetical protein
MSARERITAHASDDWECLCGNAPMLDGFYPIHDGRECEPTAEGPWDGVHYFCASCFRVIDQNTLEVVAKLDAVTFLGDEAPTQAASPWRVHRPNR